MINYTKPVRFTRVVLHTRPDAGATLGEYIAARSATPAPRAPRVLRKGETVNLSQLASQRVA